MIYGIIPDFIGGFYGIIPINDPENGGIIPEE